jgi:cytidylate kinase
MSGMKQNVIAIDGPAGAGKSTVARQVAQQLGFVYVDTGAMYRAVTCRALRGGIDTADTAAVSELAERIDVRFAKSPAGLRMMADGEDVTEAIRTPAVTAAVSLVSQIPAVRRAMVRLQRELAAAGGAVLDGRDIGTVVVPDACCKIFLTATAAERARRRWLEMREKGFKPDMAVLRREMEERDRQDSERELAPLFRRQTPLPSTRRDWASKRLWAGSCKFIKMGGVRSNSMMYHLVFWPLVAIFWLLFRLLFHLRISGLENVPQGGAIIAPNHQSFWDIPLVGLALAGRRTHFMAKSELFRNPLFARIIRTLLAFPVRRGAPDRTAIRYAIDILKQGELLTIFPEGTRSKTGELKAAEAGLALIAARARVPIVPVGIKGTRLMFSREERFPRVEIRVGVPLGMQAAESTNNEQVADVGAQVMQAVRELIR